MIGFVKSTCLRCHQSLHCPDLSSRQVFDQDDDGFDDDDADGNARVTDECEYVPVLHQPPPSAHA